MTRKKELVTTNNIPGITSIVVFACVHGYGGVLAGLTACGVMMNIVSTSSDLTQDFKTGYMTLASPKSMLASQLIGTAMGCVVSTSVFYFFLKANKDLGAPDSVYPAPYALVYRNMSILGSEGFSVLPKYCLIFCYKFFLGAILVNIVRDLVGEISGLNSFHCQWRWRSHSILAVIFHLYVHRQPDSISMAAYEQGACRYICICNNIWYDLWGWDMDFAKCLAFSFWCSGSFPHKLVPSMKRIMPGSVIDY